MKVESSRDPSTESAAVPVSGNEVYVEPKLTYLKPTLQKQGSLENLTKQGFFGLFPVPGS